MTFKRKRIRKTTNYKNMSIRNYNCLICFEDCTWLSEASHLPSGLTDNFVTVIKSPKTLLKLFPHCQQSFIPF